MNRARRPRFVLLVVAASVSIGLLIAPQFASASIPGGTWPPLGEVAGGCPVQLAIQGDYAFADGAGHVTWQNV